MITAIGAVVLLGEVLSPRLLLAAALVLGGMRLGRTRSAVRSGRRGGPR